MEDCIRSVWVCKDAGHEDRELKVKIKNFRRMKFDGELSQNKVVLCDGLLTEIATAS